MEKQTRLLVEIPELEEFLEVKLSEKSDKLLERVRDNNIIPKSELEEGIETSNEFFLPFHEFGEIKDFIKEYISKNNFDYLEVSTDDISSELSELHLYLKGYSKR